MKAPGAASLLSDIRCTAGLSAVVLRDTVGAPLLLVGVPAKLPPLPWPMSAEEVLSSDTSVDSSSDGMRDTEVPMGPLRFVDTAVCPVLAPGRRLGSAVKSPSRMLEAGEPAACVATVSMEAPAKLVWGG